MSMTADTLDSKFGTLNQDILGDLSDLTLIVEDFGESPDSDLATNLVEMGRKVIYQDDCMIRVGNKDSKAFEGRMYVLNDLLIVGKYKKSRKKKKSASTLHKTQDKIIFGEQFNTRDDIDKDFDSRTLVSAAGTLRQEGRTLKMKLWVTLEGSGTQIRNVAKQDNHGIKIVYTTKEIETVDDELEMVTNVDQTELYFDSKMEAEKFTTPIHNAIDDILEKEIAQLGELSERGSVTGSMKSRSQSLKAVEPIGTMGEVDVNSTAGRSISTLRTGKARMHTKGKIATKRLRQRSAKGAMTLEDIKNKYQVEFKPKAQSELAVYSVKFKPGPMGFALSSSGHGVFVGKLEDEGMADVSGVTLGDRVVEIGSVTVKDDMTWQECIKFIKQEKARNEVLFMKFARLKEVEEKIAKQNEEKKKEVKKERARAARKRKGAKRDWKTKRDKNKSFGTRMQSLRDLEGKYKDSGKQQKEAEKRQKLCDDLFEKLIESADNKGEKRVAFNLREFYMSEKKYVSDLYMFKDNYITRLTQKQVTMTCKESFAMTASKFCEHSKAAKNCELKSSRKRALLSAVNKKALFMNLEVLLRLNEQVLHAIQKGLVKLAKKSEVEKVTVIDVLDVYNKALIRLMPFYGMYSAYASNYPKAMDKYQELKLTSPEFGQELEAIYKKKGVKTLDLLLILPIQRLTKYPLFFREITKNIKPHLESLAKSIIEGKGGSDEDVDKLTKIVEDLKQTLFTIEKVASSVDFKVDESNKNDSLNEIYHELGGLNYIKEFFKPSRKFIKRYEDISFVEKKKLKRGRCILLFSDLIIVASYRKGSKKTLPNLSDRSSVRNAGKQSTISKGNTSTMKGKGSGRGRAFFGLTRRGEAPVLKIEYKCDMRKLKAVAIPKKGPEGETAAQLYMTVPNREAMEQKKKKSKDDTLKPSVVKIDVFFPKPVERDELVYEVKQAKTGIKEKEAGRKEAKVALTNQRSRLKELRSRMTKKARKHGNSGATLSQNRQNDLMAKVMASRKKKSGKNL